MTDSQFFSPVNVMRLVVFLAGPCRGSETLTIPGLPTKVLLSDFYVLAPGIIWIGPKNYWAVKAWS